MFFCFFVVGIIGTKIVRLVLFENGSVESRNCVAEFDTEITSISVDPVHG